MSEMIAHRGVDNNGGVFQRAVEVVGEERGGLHYFSNPRILKSTVTLG